MHPPMIWTGRVSSGAGGASKAFAYADGRRIREIAAVIGAEPYPGSLNVHLSEPFDWTAPHDLAYVLDVETRGKGLDVKWRPRTACFYPVTIGCDGKEQDAWVFRFQGERYPPSFVELVAPVRLRDGLTSEWVSLWSR